MIGKAYTSMLPYYDKGTRSNRFKGRPCLVIGQADPGDYVILPISTIPDKRRIHPYYDIRLDHTVFRFLKKDSYIRTHKQTVVNVTMLKGPLVDFKNEHCEVFIEILLKVKEFQEQMISNAL